MRKLLIFLLINMAFNYHARAEFIDCGLQEIKSVMVIGDRDDGHPHENAIVIELGKPCNGRPYGIIKRSHSAYSGMLSTALAAKSANRKLRVYLNSSKTTGSATELSILIFE